MRSARLTGVLLLVMAVCAGLARATAWRPLAFAGYLIAFALDVPVAVLFAVLLEPAGRRVAIVAAALRVVYAAIATAGLVMYAARFEEAFQLALVLFGVHLVLLGWLMTRTAAIPRLVAILVVLAGLSYLANSLTLFLAPALHARIATALVVPAMGELVLAVWLVIRGWPVRAFRP
jgi:hypothetical protein